MVTLNNIPEHRIRVAKFDYFHVFTDNKDWYFSSRKEALTFAKNLSKTEDRVRGYHVIEQEDYIDREIHILVEDCIYSKGEYPN